MLAAWTPLPEVKVAIVAADPHVDLSAAVQRLVGLGIAVQVMVPTTTFSLNFRLERLLLIAVMT